jgi:ADP-heptose:LPS heptosyltransferase
MRIVISPYSWPAKIYPHWKELIEQLNNHSIIQIGLKSEEQLVPDFRPNLTYKEIAELIESSDLWISVDNFLPHLVDNMLSGINKKGIVLWGQSDPKHFGYEYNNNLSMGKYRKNQYLWWLKVNSEPEGFVSAETVFNTITQ